MSILRTLYTGASGLRAHGEAMGAVGDNIANVDTVGFKKQQAVFEDILGRAPGGGGNQPGAGVRLADVRQVWSQGALVTTESPTDLAISGNGFFTVKGNVSGVTGNFYSRAGMFNINENGYLVNPDGLRVQGFGLDENGNLKGSPGDLLLAGQTVPATDTSSVDLSINLDSDAPIQTFDATDPSGTSSFSTTATVYDSLGQGHDVTLYFAKNASNSWDWHAMVDGGEVTDAGTAEGVPFEAASGTLGFTTDGALDTETTTASSWNFGNATAAQTIDFNFGTSITTDSGTGLDGTTQFATASATSALYQDGFSAGTVTAVRVDQDGTITGIFTNGQQRALGQLAIATFSSLDGLERSGQGLWSETAASGAALIGAAQSGSRGSVVSNAVEQANVDLGEEFVNMIAYQRGFQSTSRVITTQDELYGELVNLKR